MDARNHGDSPHTKVMSYSTMAKDIENFVKQIEAPKISFLGKNNANVIKQYKASGYTVYYWSILY